MHALLMLAAVVYCGGANAPKSSTPVQPSRVAVSTPPSAGSNTPKASTPVRGHSTKDEPRQTFHAMSAKGSVPSRGPATTPACVAR